jgi:hypothetical protein
MRRRRRDQPSPGRPAHAKRCVPEFPECSRRQLDHPGGNTARGRWPDSRPAQSAGRHRVCVRAHRIFPAPRAPRAASPLPAGARNTGAAARNRSPRPATSRSPARLTDVLTTCCAHTGCTASAKPATPAVRRNCLRSAPIAALSGIPSDRVIDRHDQRLMKPGSAAGTACEKASSLPASSSCRQWPPAERSCGRVRRWRPARRP